MPPHAAETDRFAPQSTDKQYEMSGQAPSASNSSFTTAASAKPQRNHSVRRVLRGSPARLKLERASIPRFERHSRKCQICNHPDIELIEDAFLNWNSAITLCRAYDIGTPDAIYTHARVVGLDVLRRETLRAILEEIAQTKKPARVTRTSIIRAIRALSRPVAKAHGTNPPRTYRPFRSLRDLGRRIARPFERGREPLRSNFIPRRRTLIP